MSERPSLKRLGFLHLGGFDVTDPRPGHELAVDLVRLGEELGYDSAWLRQRHLEKAISSPLLVLAAASHVTSRIELGTAVIPLAPENPFRLAEQWNTLDVLTGGRFNPGFSAGGNSIHWDWYKEKMYPGTWEVEKLGKERADHLLDLLRDHQVIPDEVDQQKTGHNDFLNVKDYQPVSAGLLDRTWNGVGSRASAEWAGKQGLNLLLSNIVRGEGNVSFDHASANILETFYEHHPLGGEARASLGVVIVPTDSATPAQLEKYLAYKAERDTRLGVAHGPAELLFAPDIVGPSDYIVETLLGDEAFQLADELVFPVPFDFEYDDYRQILGDVRELVAPRLGWSPAV